jgi:hypothetical protein
MSKIVSAGKAPRITIDAIDGDLSVVGWEGREILVKTDEDELTLEQNGEDVRLSCTDDLALRVPRDTSLVIERIGGDAALRGVMGNIEIKEVANDLSLREVGSVTIDTIRSDFSLRGARGDLSVKSVGGDVSLRDVEGNVTLESVADDLALRGARGNIKVNVGEDVVVYLEPTAGGVCAVTAGADILLVLRPNANATLSMHADAIDVDWPGVERQADVTERVLVMGDGSADIALNAGGDIRVTNDANAGNSAEEFGNFAGLNFDWSGFGDRISRQVEQATSRAAKRAEEAARRVERHARRWRGNVKAESWGWDPGGVPRPPAQPSEPVAEEERMAVLKLLAEKKITAEQAEQLLSALEGGK